MQPDPKTELELCRKKAASTVANIKWLILSTGILTLFLGLAILFFPAVPFRDAIGGGFFSSGIGFIVGEISAAQNSRERAKEIWKEEERTLSLTNLLKENKTAQEEMMNRLKLLTDSVNHKVSVSPPMSETKDKELAVTPPPVLDKSHTSDPILLRLENHKNSIEKVLVEKLKNKEESFENIQNKENKISVFLSISFIVFAVAQLLYFYLNMWFVMLYITAVAGGLSMAATVEAIIFFQQTKRYKLEMIELTEQQETVKTELETAIAETSELIRTVKQPLPAKKMTEP